MYRIVHAVGLLVAVAAGPAEFNGCGQAPDNTTDSDPVSVVEVVPPSAGPGTLVRVTADQKVFGSESEAYVTIGEKTAAIVNEIGEDEVEVLVPVLPAGATSVAIVLPDSARGKTGRLTVLPVAAEQLMLSLEDGGLRLLQATPRAGGYYEGREEGGPRLAFDVYDAEGGLIYTGAINHPTQGRFEVYDEPETGHRLIHGGTGPASAVFSLKIPYLPDGGSVDFFNVPAGVDLQTPEGREMRVFVDSVEIES